MLLGSRFMNNVPIPDMNFRVLTSGVLLFAVTAVSDSNQWSRADSDGFSIAMFIRRRV